MSVPQNDSSLCSEREERRSTPEVLTSGCDQRFFESLRDFIEHEKLSLRCLAEGPNELRYTIYRSAFNKVIAWTTSYKRLLSTIKSEYDDVIRALTRGSGEVRASRRAAVAASTSRHKSLISCQRRASNLRERISALHKETAELREEIKRNKLLKEQTTWIPGLSVAESEDPVALDGHLMHLQARKAALRDGAGRRVAPEVRAGLDTQLQAVEKRRDLKRAENQRLKTLYQRLRLLCERLSRWEEEEREGKGLLDDLLRSTLEDIRQISGVTDDQARRIDAEMFEDQEPTGADESKRLTDHLDRFMELFNLGQYEEAALLAARSPRGVLRNLDVMEMFEGARGIPGSRPPLLLFFHALLVTAPPGEALPARLSLQLARGALRHGALQLVAHAVTQRKLSVSEELGDALSEHAQRAAGAATAACLPLATVVYEACGLHRKTALSLSRRGLVRNAAQIMSHSQELSAEDCMWVLCRSPSLTLLRLLTEPQRARVAILAVGVACETLLADSQQQRLALQLLDGFVSRGPGVLKEAVLRDGEARVDVWANVASLCSGLDRSDLSRDIQSVLVDLGGSRLSSPDPDGARLMDHILL